MSLIRLQQVCLSLSGKVILDHVDLVIAQNQRIALMGRNGAGKTSLLKLIEGELEAEAGVVSRQSDRIARMSQSSPINLQQTVYEYVSTNAKSPNKIEPHLIDRCLSDCQLIGESMLDSLSGGQLRRVSLATALVNNPDVLLLDEPTNHLDLESIKWLEEFMIRSNLTIILISHDRTFIQKTCNRFIELDRGDLRSCQGTYRDFLQYKAQQLADEEKHNKLFDKRLSDEEKWIRQGIKARRTRNEGRVRALLKMREEYRSRRIKQGNMSLNKQQLTDSGKQILVIDNIGFQSKDRVLFDNFNSIVHRGDKIGIIGPNGCGKTTLINCLLGNIQPNNGKIKQGSRLEIVYFDQHRAQLDDSRCPMDIIANGLTTVTINGKEKHVISYLRDFLFTPEQSRHPIHKLSGGERNRLLLAWCLSKPSNVLVMDEPTNDLDMESLELLEEYLSEYKGTLLLISHDRSMLNNVVNCTWVFEENKIITYAGGYDDYKIQSGNNEPQKKASQKTKIKSHDAKITYEERKELSKLPRKIEKLEEKMNQKTQALASIDYTQPDTNTHQTLNKELSMLKAELEDVYSRWEVLLKKEES